MDKNTQRIFEINNRKVELRNQLEANAEGMDMDAIETELRSLDTEIATIEKRMKLTDSIKIEKPEEMRNDKMNNDTNYTIESAEYRDAYIKRLQGKPLNEVESRSYTSANGAIPTIIADQFLEKVKTLAPVLNEVTLINVAGSVTFMTEGVRDDAALHTENEAITAAGDTMLKVTLGSFEVVKVISISKTVATMSISTFQSWIVDMLAEDIARQIENYLINGTGSNQPQGVANAATWDATNSVTVALASKPTVADITNLIGLLPSAFDPNGKILMNKKTLFGDIMPLKDDSKYPLVKFEGGERTIFGYPILISDYVPLHEAYLGDYKNIIANFAQNVAIESSLESGFKNNTVDYKGSAIFDSKVGRSNAFVKLAKAAA